MPEIDTSPTMTPASPSDYRVWVEGRLPSPPLTAKTALEVSLYWERRGARVALRRAAWAPGDYMRPDGFPR